MRRRNKALLSLLLSGTMLLSGCVMVTEPETVGTSEASETEEARISAAPQAKDDFYGYVNYDTIRNTTIEYGESGAGSFADVSSTVIEQLYEIITEIGESSESYPAGSSEQLIHDLYQQVISDDGGDAAMSRMMEDIKAVRSADSINEVVSLWNEMRIKYGVNCVLTAAPLRDYRNPEAYALYFPQISSVSNVSFEDMMKNDDACSQLWGYSEDILLAIGDEAEAAAETSEDFVYLALELARFTDISVQYADDPYADCTFITERELADMLPTLEMSAAELGYGTANPYDGYYVQDPEQLRTLGKLLTEEYLDEWKTWVVVDIVNACGSYVSRENKLLTSLYGSADDSTKARLEACFSVMLQEELGEVYAERYFTEEMDAAVTEMFEDIIGSYRVLISEADWLSSEARESLLRKLENIRLVKGCTPREADASDAELIGGSLFDTFVNLNRRTAEEYRGLLGAPYDKNTMDMTPQTVNACYNTDNKVTITVAIMNVPFFSTDSSYYENLGGLGAVVAHEVGHAFDSSCINYDENGRYNPEWLSEADRKVLSERADIVTDYFSEYAIMDVYHVDGELTNGENYADLGGVECIVSLAETEDDLRTLFESYARIWCSVSVDTDAINMLSLDVHSPDMVRVNAVLSSCDKFYEVYDIKEGDGMYKAPEERVSRW